MKGRLATPSYKWINFFSRAAIEKRLLSSNWKFYCDGGTKKNFWKKPGFPESRNFFQKFFFRFFFHFMATVGLALFERPPPIKKLLRQSCRARRAYFFLKFWSYPSGRNIGQRFFYIDFRSLFPIRNQTNRKMASTGL